MRSYSIRFPAVLGLILLPVFLFAQQNSDSLTGTVPSKFALVIGNGAYKNLARLSNPENDANDMADALESLGFTVDRLIDASLEQMDSAAVQLKNRLSMSKNTYGFFFYAGHGVQSNGENYLVPVDASIPDESFLSSRSQALQDILQLLNSAGNCLNVVVLDACRDNPFGWSRGGNRGLALVDFKHADSIIVYATSAGQTAKDGSGRNGLFTSQLLPNLKTPGLEINEIFRRTMGDVMRVSGNMQCPAIYNQFPGLAYFSPPLPAPAQTVQIPEASAPIAAAPVAAAAPAAEPAAVPDAPPAIAAKPAPVPRPALPPAPRPVPRPVPRPLAPSKGPASAAETGSGRLNTIGVSVGSTFAAPWFTGTVHGTFSPANNAFFELGFDLGLLSGAADVKYYSLFPYAHAALFWPFAGRGGAYIGAGGGYMMATYTFQVEGELPKNDFVVDIIAGVNFFDIIDLSYTLRTNYARSNNKVAAGFVYRFR